jgi:hypothetical protein
MDPGNYNGASLVGLTGIVVKSHGSADIASFCASFACGDERNRARYSVVNCRKNEHSIKITPVEESAMRFWCLVLALLTHPAFALDKITDEAIKQFLVSTAPLLCKKSQKS